MEILFALLQPCAVQAGGQIPTKGLALFVLCCVAFFLSPLHPLTLSQQRSHLRRLAAWSEAWPPARVSGPVSAGHLGAHLGTKVFF